MKQIKIKRLVYHGLITRDILYGDLEYDSNLTDENIESLNEIAMDLKELNADYKELTENMNTTFAYSKLSKEIDVLSMNLSNLEDRLE